MEEEDVPLPGFRFHPTDEELVRFYLRRKVENKPIKLQIIKQMDIYKFDPWNLPRSDREGENDSYFFCKRGRKYRNSVRPNRVTRSGFWKATGIDRPVYSHGSEGNQCIGLKKTLVYYRGSAGKGTKTDWMMHEFRLPCNHGDTNAIQEAEVWTVCRIFERKVSHRKYTQDWREVAGKRSSITNKGSSPKCSFESNNGDEKYISFGAPNIRNDDNDDDDDEKQGVEQITGGSQLYWTMAADQLNNVAQTPLFAPSPSFADQGNDFFPHANWDELTSVIEFALENPFTSF